MASQVPPFTGVLDQEPQRRQLADLSDGLLAQYALAGDQSAFAILIHRFTGPLFKYAYHILQDANEAEDILQQVFLKLYLSLSTFHVEEPLKPWLFHVTRNQCMDHLRRKPVLHFSELEASGDESRFTAIAMLADTSPLPEEVAEQLDLQQAIQRAIHTLPPKVRSIIMLRYAEQLSYTEIAERLGIPTATVKTYFHRAKSLLRAALLSQKR